MFVHHFHMAWRNIRSNPILSMLMVLAIALGIGACMTSLTVFRVLSGDPIPEASSRLFYPQLDPRPRGAYQPGDAPEVQMTRYDAETLLAEGKADRQALMSAGGVEISSATGGSAAFKGLARYASADFFPMFLAPFAHGGPWDAKADADRGRVAVISKGLNDRLFGGENSVGRSVLLNGTAFSVIGVLGEWRVVPRFYDLTASKYGEAEKVFIPFSTAMDLRFETVGNTACWRDPGDDPYSLAAPCTWVQYWVELRSSDRVESYRQYLTEYAERQRSQGRYERPANVRLMGVMDWLDDQRATPADVRLQLWLSLAFLLVCVVNTVGLLLAKFLRKTGDYAIRRAIGASRGDVFQQALVEAGCIGIAGSVLGLGVAALGLWFVRMQPSAYASLAQLDGTMLAITFATGIVSSLIAGAFPAWRVSVIEPGFGIQHR